MKDYANGEERVKLAYLKDVDLLYTKFIDQSRLLTQEEKTEFKHARTRHQKAFKMLGDRLPKDFKKIENILKDNMIVMEPKIKELITRRAIAIDDDRLRDILEVMIHDHCVGCTANNWKNCHIYKLNDDLEVSSEYREPDGTCAFSYMSELEKAKNPTYGAIFRED